MVSLWDRDLTFFSLSCGSSLSPSPADPSFVSCLQWKHVDEYCNVLSLSSLASGAVIGDGQSAVASNIANTTYRLQWWDFTKFDLPEISNGKPRENWGYWWKSYLSYWWARARTPRNTAFFISLSSWLPCAISAAPLQLLLSSSANVLSTHP